MKKATVSESIKRLAFAAMLTAMSVVIGIFCKTALNFADGLFRITFENMPIILAGVLFGPIIGGAVGVASDLLSYILSGQTFAPNPVVTLGAAVVGIISGVVAKYIIKKRGATQFIVAGASAHLIGSVIIKSIGLFVFYNWLVLWRIPTYMLIVPVEVIMLILLYKNKAVRRMMDKVSPIDIPNASIRISENTELDPGGDMCADGATSPIADEPHGGIESKDTDLSAAECDGYREAKATDLKKNVSDDGGDA